MTRPTHDADERCAHGSAPSERGGVILLWSLVWCAFMLVTVLGYYPLLRTSRAAPTQTFQLEQARQLAETGANEAFWYAQHGLLRLMTMFFGQSGITPPVSLADLNADTRVNIIDVAWLRTAASPTQGPFPSSPLHGWVCLSYPKPNLCLSKQKKVI